MERKKSVLFLCTGNSCRSQMAEGWAREFHGDTIDIFSAGIETHGLNPNAVAVMAEAGVDITSQKSELIDVYMDKDIDLVVTVCDSAHETCPFFPSSAKVVHHGFDDPPRMAAECDDEEAKLDCYRRVRDKIREYAKTLLAELE